MKPTISDNITTDTLPKKLKTARLQKKLSVADVANELKLPPEEIQKFENGKYDTANVYTQGNLKAYARYLGVDLVKRTYVGDTVEDSKQRRSSAHPKQGTPSIARSFKPLRSFVASTTLVRTWIVGIIITSIAAVCFLVFRLLAPPTLVVTAPGTDQFLQASSVVVEGRTTTGSEVFINDTPVLVDLDGNFSDRFLLREGVNEIEIAATNSLSRTARITRVIVAEYPELEDGR